VGHGGTLHPSKAA